MAAGGATAVSRGSADSPHDREEAALAETSALALHERLVAYVHTLAHGTRRGVWGEHSYARARGAGGGGAVRCGSPPRVRTLLAPPTPRAPPALLDVVGAPSPPPSPPPLDSPEPEDDDDTDAEDGAWEERVCSAAPGKQHARAADVAADALRDMRLARLAGAGAGASARAAARRLRRALAPLWGGGAPAWLHAQLTHHLPSAERRLYDEVVAELRRAVPRLARRMTGAEVPPPARPLVPPAVGPDSSPWLVWVSSGCAALDARWEPHLSALVHTRVLRGAGGAPRAEGAPPEPWCAAAAAAVRSALTDALAEAGSRAVILGGVGCGGAVALVLARGAGGAGRAEGGVRGAVLVAPPLSTAEGGREARDDALHALRLPLLVVCGSRAAQCARHAALSVCSGAPERRLLEVRGADDELRLAPRLRARHRLPQRALDAALLEEVVRWAVETAEREEAPPSPPAPAPARAARVLDIDLGEEYSHLPPAAPAPAPASTHSTASHLKSRSLDVEGRVVSRVSGGTPLKLLAPRRAGAGAGAAHATSLAAADIMQLPIVFADDEPPSPGTGTGSVPVSTPLTVTSGKPTKRGASAAAGEDAGPGAGAGGASADGGDASSVKFTRVILAKRGARAGGAGAAGRGASGGAGGGGARRLLLRRGVRLVPTRQP